MENTVKEYAMNWDMIVSNVLSTVATFILGRLMDIAVSYWHNRRNE